MYKIILADGKEIVINSLIYIIEKEFAKICSIASAKTGRTAIELAENFRPDIAVIDIHLPGINGLEVIREIKKNNHNVKFIALSADEKFDSLKKALRLGVLDYITKPLDRSQFTQALAAAMIQIDGLRKKRSADLNTKEKMSYILPLIEKGLIYHLLLQEYFEPDIIHYRNLLGFQQEYGYMINIIYEEKEPGNNNARVIERKIPLAQYYQEICILIKGSFNGLIGSLMVHTIPVLIPYSNSQMTSDEQIELIEKAQTLVRKLQQNVNTRFRIGIGSIQSWHHQLESFHDSLQALRHSTDRVAYTELSSLAKPNNTAILKDRLFEKTFDSSVHTITKQSIKNSDLIVQALDYINSRYHKELS
jgi:two-component system response regulator YesN